MKTIYRGLLALAASLSVSGCQQALEQISETVSKYLREEDITLVVVGDRGQVSEQVADWIGTAPE